MSAHQHKSNTKSIVSAGSSIAKSAAVAKLSAPERKAVRKAQAQSSKRVKNQHEIIMNSYINDAKIAHAKPKPTYEEKMVQKVKRDAWEARKPSTRMRKSVEIARDVLLKEESISRGEISDMVNFVAELEDDYYVSLIEKNYYDCYDDFEWMETSEFRKFAKTYDPIAFRGSFMEYMHINFPPHYRKVCEEKIKKMRSNAHACSVCFFGYCDSDEDY